MHSIDGETVKCVNKVVSVDGAFNIAHDILFINFNQNCSYIFSFKSLVTIRSKILYTNFINQDKRMHQRKKEEISKFLSLVLRHKPEIIDLKLDTNGWINIDELITKSKDIVLTKALLFEIVHESDKKRFAIKGNKIRANQGHSIKVNLELETLTPLNTLYHGTAIRFLDSIMHQGLTKQTRQYVHLSQTLQTALSVGKRHGKVAILEINTKKMIQEGHTFYQSQNGVWLIDFVPTEFIKRREEEKKIYAK